jgi:hypothetical protein
MGGTHGLGSGETFETQAGAQSKANSAENAAENYADSQIENHRTGETHTTAQPPQGHSGDHEDGGSDELPVESLPTSGAPGTVPVAQGGGGLAMGAVGHWNEDSNSPFDINGSSGTITLADRYDMWVLEVQNEGGGFAGNCGIQVNGYTGTEYNYVDHSGNKTSDDSKFAKMVGAAGISRILLTGRWVTFGIAALPLSTAQGGAISGDCFAVDSPLTSVRFVNDGGFGMDLRVRAYGKDI